jgi:sec-independent protein translocase protein TatB
MFEIGWGELLLIGIVALIAIGPKELPTVLRTLGQWMAKLRRMASEFQNQFHEAMREAEMADLKKQVDDLTSTAHSYANFDPVSEVRREFESTQQQIESAMAKPLETPAAPAPESGESATPAAAQPALTQPAPTQPALAPPGTDTALATSVAPPSDPVPVGVTADNKHDDKPT